jgi:hypothetical protein
MSSKDTRRSPRVSAVPSLCKRRRPLKLGNQGLALNFNKESDVEPPIMHLSHSSIPPGERDG